MASHRSISSDNLSRSKGQSKSTHKFSIVADNKPGENCFPGFLPVISYQLIIKLCREARIKVGRLGEFYFPAGWYVYTGSAKRNISARIKRHLSKVKKLRWHIDYLLANPFSEIVEVKKASVPECELNQRTPGVIVINGFGSSDCKNNCKSHLKYLGIYRE